MPEASHGGCLVKDKGKEKGTRDCSNIFSHRNIILHN